MVDRPVTRSEARTLIVATAAKVRHRTNLRIGAAAQRTGKPLGLRPPITMRNLNEAVCIVRRRRLVSPEVLTLAGFRATERKR